MIGTPKANTRRPSLSLTMSPQAANNIPNGVTGTDKEDAPRFRRPASRRQGMRSNSFTSSSKHAADIRKVDVGAERGKKGGMFQFRRRTMLDEHNDDVPYSISNFQQIFHEVKAENPTASMGAIQQMTMRRLSETRQSKKKQQYQSHKPDYEEEGKVGLAAKTLNKLVDAIRVTASDEAEDSHVNKKKIWNRSLLNDSFRSASSGDEDGGLMSFNHFLRRPSASGPARRASQDSSGPHDFNASNESLFRGNEIISKARTANEMYAIAANEQGENMAPRRSIGDLTALMSVGGDQSDEDRKSLRSDLSVLLLEELTKSNMGEDNGGSLRGNWSGEIIEAVTGGAGESTTHCTGIKDGNEVMDQWIDNQFDQVTGRTTSSFDNSQQERFDLNHSRHSDTKSAISDAKSTISGLSGYSDCTSAWGDGLIVGFRPRRFSGASNWDEDHLNAGNFASDFSAWE